MKRFMPHVHRARHLNGFEIGSNLAENRIKYVLPTSWHGNSRPIFDHPEKQNVACSPPVSRLITFSPKRWQAASPPGKVRGDATNPLISRPGRLRTPKIPMLLLVSSAVTHHCYHRPALLFRDWNPFTKPVLILPKEISSTFVPRGFAVLYPISRSGKSPPPSEIRSFSQRTGLGPVRKSYR